MSKNINVNPDHYKTGGRERQGEAIVQKEHRTKMASAQHDLAARSSQRRETLERKASAAREQAGAKEPLFESTEKEGAKGGAKKGVSGESGRARPASGTKSTKSASGKAADAAPKATSRTRNAAAKAKAGAKKGARAVAKGARKAVKRAKNAVRGPRQSLPKRSSARKK